jgi:excisionase family DNA binding protein
MTVKDDDLERRFLTVADAAVYTGLSQESIRRLLARGRLHALRPVRGRVLIDRHELEALVLTSTATPRTGRGRRGP